MSKTILPTNVNVPHRTTSGGSSSQLYLNFISTLHLLTYLFCTSSLLPFLFQFPDPEPFSSLQTSTHILGSSSLNLKCVLLSSPFCILNTILSLLHRLPHIFSCGHATLWEALSVGPSVPPSVRRSLRPSAHPSIRPPVTAAQSLTVVDLKWSPPTSVVSWPWWCIEYISRKNDAF